MIGDSSLIFSFEWNWYALPSFIAVFVNLGLASYIYFKPRQRDLASVLYLIFTLCLAIWAALEGFTRISGTAAVAAFWANAASFGWIFMSPVFFHFALAFSRHERFARHPIIIAALYLPALIFYFLNLSTTLLLNPVYGPVPWGWENLPPTPFFNLAFSPWLEFFFIASLILFWRERGRKDATIEERRRATIIAAGLFVPLITGTVSQIIFPMFNIAVVGLTTIFMPVLAVAVFVAMVRYRLFILTPSAVFNTVLKAMNDVVITADTEGRIQFMNAKGEQLLSWGQEDLPGHDLSILFPQHTNRHEQFVEGVIAKLLRGEQVVSYETVWSTSKGQPIPMAVSAAPVYPSEGGFEPLGFVLVAHDLRYSHALVEKLRSITTQLRVAKSKVETKLGATLRST